MKTKQVKKFSDVRRLLEGLGGDVQIIRNQNKDGTLGKPWLKAEWELSNRPWLEAMSLAESIWDALPECHSVEVERMGLDSSYTIQTSYHPMSDSAGTPSDYSITHCWVRCPTVGDAE